MARPRKFDPDEVVERSMRAFWEHGYRETSVDDLVAATSVQPGSLYNAFRGGKRELFLQSLERYSSLVVPEKLGALEAPGASLAEVRAYFDALVEDLMSEDGRIGCLIVNSTVELAADDSVVAALASGHMERLERNTARALRTAKRRGEIPKKIDPAARAKLLMATGMGLMVVGKTNPGREVLETIVQAAFAELG
ncbi:MAG TPA: TetR/AcrR family transcriptional regulator [Solirubrobacteraceae bacterium]|jgi:TetR/AcrR family transcriptional repressor of nem operon|nr:TetR/AcrR family transcriptional regulator [Solirubrobacteraceae bacterium]